MHRIFCIPNEAPSLSPRSAMRVFCQRTDAFHHVRSSRLSKRDINQPNTLNRLWSILAFNEPFIERWHPKQFPIGKDCARRWHAYLKPVPPIRIGRLLPLGCPSVEQKNLFHHCREYNERCWSPPTTPARQWLHKTRFPFGCRFIPIRIETNGLRWIGPDRKSLVLQ